MKNEKGMSLITLIITIVILLMLAAVFIVAFTGKNGLFHVKTAENVFEQENVYLNENSNSNVKK